MDLFIVVIAIAFIQVWGADNPLHRDEWLPRWLSYLEGKFSLPPRQFFIVAVGVPLLAVALVMWLLSFNSYWLLLPVSVVLLLYSFGRGEFSELITQYTQACQDEDWDSGISRAVGLGVDTEGITREDWSSLHQHMLDEAAYRGFERMFAVLFWFFLAGPLAALLYRLVFLFNREMDSGNPPASRFLWLLEWPAVRVLGLSFALTGNFVGCIARWRESVFCVTRPTATTIGQSVLGALSIDDDVTQTCEVTRKELSFLDRLYKRTLWFWLAATAMIVILV